MGINQGLTWSTTVIMKIDLAGHWRRGLAMGLNETAGYLAVAVTAAATGYLAARYGLRPAPFLLGLSYAALGLGLSVLMVRETRGLAWGLFPILFTAAGLSVSRIGILAALYPAVWGLGQLLTGPLSDRCGANT